MQIFFILFFLFLNSSTNLLSAEPHTSASSDHPNPIVPKNSSVTSLDSNFNKLWDDDIFPAVPNTDDEESDVDDVVSPQHHIRILPGIPSTTTPLEQDRLSELQQEYEKGERGSYGDFVAELKNRLTHSTDLKEAARLATLIRAYIHGQILAFDQHKPLTDKDRFQVLHAHAAVTAFLTLSPLGTDRYREDTLRWVMHDVHGRYAQELTIVADAVQAALWAGEAGTPEHVRKEVFLRWMNPLYQKGGAMDVSAALGHWEYGNHQNAQTLVDEVLGKFYLGSSLPQLAAAKQQAQILRFKEGTIINVPGDGQCGFFSVGNPYFRNADNYSGNLQISQKIINAFDRALYDSQLFWLLVVYCSASSWPEPEYDCLKYEKTVQNDPRVKEFLLHQLVVKHRYQLKEVNILLSKLRSMNELNAEDLSFFENQQKALNESVLSENSSTVDEESLEKTSKNIDALNQMLMFQLKKSFFSDKTLSNEQFGKLLFWTTQDSMKPHKKPDFLDIAQAEQMAEHLKKDLVPFWKWFRGEREKNLEESREFKDFESTYQTLNAYRNDIIRDQFMSNAALFDSIPLSIKQKVIESSKIQAAYSMYSTVANRSGGGEIPENIQCLKDVKIENTGNQLEIAPGDDLNTASAVGILLEEIVAYLNDQSLFFLCSESVMQGRQDMRLSSERKKGVYYIGRSVHHHPIEVGGKNVGRIYTCNNGGAYGGHYTIYATDDTPAIAIANGLRNPMRHDEWDLFKSAHQSQLGAPGGTNFQNWFQAY